MSFFYTPNKSVFNSWGNT